MSLIKLVLTTLFIINFENLCANSANNQYTDWEQLINASKAYESKLFVWNAKLLKTVINSVNVSEKCAQSLTALSTAAKNFDNDWPFQMLDSWGDFPPKGILHGTVSDFGDYDQCVSITPNSVMGKPQYCLIDISFPMPEPAPKHLNFYHSVNVLPDSFRNRSENNVFRKLSKSAAFFYWVYLRLGICVPDKCRTSDIALMAKYQVNKFGLSLKNVKCETKSVDKLTTIQALAIFVVLSFSIITVISPFCVNKYPLKKNPSKFESIINAFSLSNNFKRLMSTETTYGLTCLSGLRVLALIWVIFGHTVAWNNLQIFNHSFQIKHVLSAPGNQLFLKAYNSVETFFFMSGMLTSYITLKQTKEKFENFNSLVFLVSRYIRLTPQLAIFILLTSLVPLMGSGPVWNEWITPLVDNCYKNWWQNLIYMQNIIDPKNMCALHTWFIATDMQYHWMSLLVIIAMLYRYKIGFAINVCITCAFFVLSAIIIFLNNFPPGYVNTGKSDFYVNVYDPMFYWKPWSHGSVFFVGLGFGYFAYKQKPVTLTNGKKSMIWFCLLIGYIISIYDVQYWIYGAPYNRWISSLLYPTTRVIWSVNTAVLIWMCITGNGGAINAFLCWKPFIPLSRLTYSIFLTHAWSVWVYMGSKRQLIEPDVISMLAIFFNHLIISLFIGALFSLLFEAPFLILLNYLLNRHKLYDHRLYRTAQHKQSNDVALLSLRANITKLTNDNL